MDPGRCPRPSLQRTGPMVARHPSLRPSPGPTRASTRLPAVVPVQARTPGSADKIHSAQIAFEILAQIGWFGLFHKVQKQKKGPIMPPAAGSIL